MPSGMRQESIELREIRKRPMSLTALAEDLNNPKLSVESRLHDAVCSSE